MYAYELIIYTDFPPNVMILKTREIDKYHYNIALHLHNIVFIVTNKQYYAAVQYICRSITIATIPITVTRVMYNNNQRRILFSIFLPNVLLLIKNHIYIICLKSLKIYIMHVCE